MRLGILSDIHDNLPNLEAAIASLNASADTLLCCGDLCSPFVMDVLRKFSGPVHIIFGNNDADLFRITKKADARLQVHGEFLELELAGRKLAANHFDNIALPIARSGIYDLVCFGHNHRISTAKLNGTLAVNPGPILGIAFGPSGWERVAPTFAVCELASMDLAFFQVGEGGSVAPYRYS